MRAGRLQSCAVCTRNERPHLTRHLPEFRGYVSLRSQDMYRHPRSAGLFHWRRNNFVANWLARDRSPLSEVDADTKQASPFPIAMAIMCLLRMGLMRRLKARFALELTKEALLRTHKTTPHPASQPHSTPASQHKTTPHGDAVTTTGRSRQTEGCSSAVENGNRPASRRPHRAVQQRPVRICPTATAIQLTSEKLSPSALVRHPPCCRRHTCADRQTTRPLPNTLMCLNLILDRPKPQAFRHTIVHSFT